MKGRVHGGRWEDLRQKTFTPSQLEEIDRRAKKLLLAMDLREMRKLAGVTQVELAKRLKVSQGQVSDAERRDDHRLSTLRRYIEALGGDLEVVARLGDKWIRLHGV